MTLKSKSGFLIHEQIIDPNDPKRFFTKDPERVNTGSRNSK